MTANGDAPPPEELWRHRAPEATPMWAFMQTVNAKHSLQLKTYRDLYDWSVTDIPAFWEETWHFCGVTASQPYTKVLDPQAPMYPRPAFFPGARLNFAQNLLYPANAPAIDPHSPALLLATETARATVTWAQLRARVARCQAALKAVGVVENDRVAGYVGNGADAVIAMLAATSLGAVWTAISPDSGVSMVLDRLRQIEPRVLFADDGQVYNGRAHGVLGKVREVLEGLGCVEVAFIFRVVGVGSLEEVRGQGVRARVVEYDELESSKSESVPEMEFKQLQPDHPVYILYSSGTTGAPKCIVHGAIGTLLQHKKEHMIHSSIAPSTRLFYYTTCTWMMWHWLISGLASGATLILYDGSPMRYRSATTPNTSDPDDLAMPRLIDELDIQHFGTSAKYLSILEQRNVQPRAAGLSLASLKAIYNTASPLAPSTFRYVYEAFGPDINLASITGGTDIISLFGAASPLTPVYAGEVQVPGLGMAVRAWTDDGTDVTEQGEPGDLVCIRPFICQPVAFWGPGGADRYRGSYFERFHGVWHHGDYVRFSSTGGMVMLGRSDGVLNPAGVRFGSAEIYNVLLKGFAGRVQDGLCVGRRVEGESDEVVVLFVKMEEGEVFDAELVRDIKSRVKSELSARHVPAVVDECPDIPVTVNGKKVEGAVKQIISGSKVKTSASVANAECLDFYRQWAETH